MQKLSFITTLLILTLTLTLTACLGQSTRIYVGDDSEADDAETDTEVGETGEDVDATETDAEGESDETDEPDSSDEVDTPENEDSEDVEDDEVSSEPARSENIIVEEPLPGATVTSPFEISGQARVFEGTVLVRVKNQDGKVVIPTQIVTAHGADAGEFGDWKIKINYVFYATKEGTIEVFSEDARNGSEINMVEVPVKFE